MTGASLLDVWVPGTPRGYGDQRIEEEWRTSIRQALAGIPPLAAGRYGVRLHFRLYALSKSYRGNNKEHGTDLDNLIKTTIDALTLLGGKGLGLILNDNAIYAIDAEKALVDSDEQSGVRIQIHQMAVHS